VGKAMRSWLLRAGAAGHQLMAKDYFRLNPVIRSRL